MSPFPICRVLCGTMLLLMAGRTAGAQTAKLYVGEDAAPTGRTRELVCRGKPGIDLRIEQDPSPRRADQVAMVLRYERPREVRSAGQEGSVQFVPGSCSWNLGGFEGVPPEPGEVYFDLPRDAQAHAGPGQRDTTAAAAIAFPDIASMSRYLSDSSHVWLFYVNDATNLSISFRSSELVTQGSIDVAGSLRDAAPGSTTLSSARVLADSHRATVVRAPNSAGGAAGTLRGSGAGATTAAGTKVLRDTGALSVDTTARTTTVRPPTMTPAPAPSAGSGGSLRGGAATSTPSVRTSASLPADGGVARPRPAPGNDTLLSARAITAGKGPGNASTSRTLLPDVRIWGVATAPGSQGVRLVFNTDREPAAFGTNGIGVQFSRQRPPWDSTSRRWAYPPGWDSPWYAEVSRPAQGGYLAEPRGKLELRQRYYYLITVESNDASLPPRQEIGSFTASASPFAKAPPAPGPDPAANDDFGDPLRGDATDVAGTLRGQAPGAATAAGTTARPANSGTAQTAGPATSRTRLPPDVRIWNIETKPGNNGVKLSFQTDRVWVRTSSGVRVQFSDRQPRWEGGLLVSPAVDSRAGEVVSGWFEAEPHWTLQAGKRYYYLITVASNDPSLRPRQATGSFLPAFGR